MRNSESPAGISGRSPHSHGAEGIWISLDRDEDSRLQDDGRDDERG